MPTSPEFVHLHTHTEYSMLDGNSRINRLVAAAAQRGMRALAITDHGSMHGAIPFYDACRKQNINPIQGVEAYLADNMREKGATRYEYNHLLLLAMDETGYTNLMKLTTLAHTEGYYQKPRIDKPTLAQYNAGLIATSGCLAGEIPQFFLADKEADAYAAADWYLQVFGRDRFYIEIQDHLSGGDQAIVNPHLIEMAKRLNLRMVATNDLHYVEKADHAVQDVMLCVQTNARINDADRMRFDGPEYYLKSADEMANLFTGLESALSNTVRIAEMCHVDIPFGRNLLPQYDVPTGEPQDKYLWRLVHAGMVERYGVDWKEKTINGIKLWERMNYEFNIILSKGFVPYFLIVWDYVNYARRNGMRAVARGSVAGSIVAYALGISNVDPLHYGLLFERFLNPERNSMPDIDMDFPDDRREEVIRYVANKYGWDKVGQIATMIVMQAKTAVRDVGRVFGDYQTSDRISRLMGDGSHLESELVNNQQLRDLYTSDHQARIIIDMARHLDGTVRGDSVHAAGVVMANVPLVEVTPCQHLKRERGLTFSEKNAGAQRWLVAQYEHAYLERLGILKFDFLGLSNLTIIQNTLAFVKQYYGDDVDIERIPDDDVDVFRMLSAGDTTGVFQLESPPMRAYIRELKPTSVHDIMAMVALYRPGPMDSIPRFIKAKHGIIPPTYPHADVEDILRDSYGVIVYQDQVLLVAQRLAGLSWAELDKFRKAIGKKIMTGPDSVEAQKQKFIKGCVKNGISAEKADEIFAFIEPFAGYGFNRCAHGSTEIQLPDGSRTTLSAAYRNPPTEIMAMWPDGHIRPHKVARIVQTGRKPLLQIRTASGKSIKVTREHRLLTTEGYLEAGVMQIGTELIVAPKRVTEKQRAARREMITRLNKTAEHRTRVSSRVKAYQAGRSDEEKRDHMKRMHALYPEMTRESFARAQERSKWLMANDLEWRRRKIEQTIANSRACYDTGPGYGRCSIASNGMWCASQPERDMCEWLIEQGIVFEMHKVLGNGRVCDFYFNGIYWEMDGMDRTQEYFAAKYGDMPYVVVTPEDFKPVVLRHLGVDHAENGDAIVSIEPCGEAMTYDVEMAPDGPLNFIANRIVSHNSHAAAYAWVAYQTAWLKVHYPAAFMAATLSKEAGDQTKIAHIVAECKRMGVAVLPPDVNTSDAGFTLEQQNGVFAVRFGLTAIKGLGERQCAGLLRERAARGPFTTLAELFARVEARAFTSASVTAMVRAGAMTSLGEPNALLAGLEDAKKLGKKYRGTPDDTLFGERSPLLTYAPPPITPASQEQRLAWEKEVMGVYVSGHPLTTNALGDTLLGRADTRSSDIGADTSYKTVTVAGLIEDITHRQTARGDSMASLTLEDLDGSVEVVVFPAVYEKARLMLKKGNPVIITGQVRPRNIGGEAYQIVATNVTLFSPEMERMRANLNNPRQGACHIYFDSQGGARDIALHKLLAATLGQHPGETPYVIYRVSKGTKLRMSSSGEMGVRMSDTLIRALNAVAPVTIEQEVEANVS